MKRCYYEILEIDRQASSTEVKTSYRKMAMKFHPDRNSSEEAESLFKEASEAYEVLSDPEKRGVYDRFGHQGLDRQGMHHGYADVGDIFSNFSDIFEDFFGFGGRGTGGNRGGRDLRYDLQISFEEAYFGAEKKFNIPKHEDCPDCGGKGYPDSVTPSTCSHCQGSGQLLHNQGFITISSACGACRGQGQTVDERCDTCSGSGKVQNTKNLKVRVPPGVDDGMQLCLRGEGEGGSQGGPDGDLYVVLQVAAHERYHRQGEHLVVQENISLVTAALGQEIEVETPDGMENLSVPAGAETGDVLKIKGKGMPDVHSKHPGDFLVQLFVKTPKNLSPQQKEILQEFSKLSGEAHEEKKGENTFTNSNKKSKKPKRSSWFK